MTKVLDLANDYNLDIKQNRHHIKYECKMVVIDRFISNWHSNRINTEINPGLRTYQTIKKSFRPELYLRYTRPKTPIQERLCKSCGVNEDEAHFILSCQINQSLRAELIKNIESIYAEFNNMTENEGIYFIFNNEDRRKLTWFGKCLHNSFMLLRELLS